MTASQSQPSAGGSYARPADATAGSIDVAGAADGRRMAQTIAGAQYVELDAAHISNVEAADRFNAEVMQFLEN